MFERERSHMSIGHEIGMQTRQSEKLLQQISVALARVRNPYRFTSEPLAQLAPSIDH